MKGLEECSFVSCDNHGMSIFHREYGCIFCERERLKAQFERIMAQSENLVAWFERELPRVGKLLDEYERLKGTNVQLAQDVRFHLAHVEGLQERLGHLQRQDPAIARKLIPIDDTLE